MSVTKRALLVVVPIALIAVGIQAIEDGQDFLLGFYVIAGSIGVGAFMWKAWGG